MRDDIYKFGRPLLGHPYQILSSSDLCPAVMKKTFQEIMHFHDMARIWPRPSARTPVLNLSDLMFRSRDDFSRNNAFSLLDYFGHALAQEHVPLEVRKFIILVDTSLLILTKCSVHRSREEIMHFHCMAYLAMT